MKIGLLEDQIEIAETLSRTLVKAGHICAPFENGDTFKRFLRRETVDLLILDWNVPGTSGLEILKWSKERLPNQPVLMLTGRSDPDDIISAFRAGADEYVVKPVQPEVLLARVEALERLAFRKETANPIETYGKFRFELSERKLFLDERLIDLTAKEFDLALILFRNRGRTLSRSYLYEMIWGTSSQQTRSLDVHISKLRTKALLTAENGSRLRPIYAYGYRLELGPEPSSS